MAESRQSLRDRENQGRANGTLVPADLRERLRDPENVVPPVNRQPSSTATAAPIRRPAAPIVPEVFRQPEWEVVPPSIQGLRNAGMYMTVERGGGRFTISADAWKAIGSPEAVTVMICRAPRMLALRPVSASDANGTRVRTAKSGQGRFSSTETHLLLDLDASVAMRYRLRVEDGMLVADMSPSAGVAVRRKVGGDGR